MSLIDNSANGGRNGFVIADKPEDQVDFAVPPLLASLQREIFEGKHKVLNDHGDDITQDAGGVVTWVLESVADKPTTGLTAKEKMFCTLGVELVNEYRQYECDVGSASPPLVKALAAMLLFANRASPIPWSADYTAVGLTPYFDIVYQLAGHGVDMAEYQKYEDYGEKSEDTVLSRKALAKKEEWLRGNPGEEDTSGANY